MSNPRPCVCGHPPLVHSRPTGAGFCLNCYMFDGCDRYRKMPRKEPLRAPGHRSMKSVRDWIRKNPPTIPRRRPAPLRARRLCPHGRPGVVNMIDHIGFGPFVESVPGRVECPPECYEGAWTQADIGADIRDSLSAPAEPRAEFRFSDGRVMTAKAEWKDDRWHVEWPPSVSGQAVVRVRLHAPA